MLKIKVERVGCDCKNVSNYLAPNFDVCVSETGVEDGPGSNERDLAEWGDE